MSTREVATAYRMSQWAQIMHERASSGVSIAEFCLAKGINRSAYFYWQRKLRKAACIHMAEEQSKNLTELVPSTFAEVKILQESEKQSTLADDGQLKAEFGSMKIVVDSRYPVANLASLLRELIATC